MGLLLHCETSESLIPEGVLPDIVYGNTVVLTID
jgi:hypothetical protein